MYDIRDPEEMQAFLEDLYHELKRAEEDVYPSIPLWERLEPVEQQYVRIRTPQLADGLETYVERMAPVTEHHGYIAKESKSLRNTFPRAQYDYDSDTNEVNFYLYLEDERFETSMTNYFDRYAEDIVAAEDEEELEERLANETRHWTRHFLNVRDDWPRYVWRAATQNDPSLKERYELRQQDRRRLEPFISHLQAQTEDLLTGNIGETERPDEVDENQHRAS